MIQANELRIGNWVQRPESVRIDILDGGKIYWLVDSLMIRDCEYYKDNWAFEPIPLTPEILEKCGAEKFPTGNKDYTLHGLLINWAECRSVFTHNGKELPNLHTLQNYIFALTGEELTFKP